MSLSLPSSSSTLASTASASNALALDIRSLNALKFDAGTANSAQVTREAAKQFESLFMREMIKSMREATMKSGLLDGSPEDRPYTRGADVEATFNRARAIVAGPVRAVPTRKAAR